MNLKTFDPSQFTILIVDDIPKNLQVLGNVLNQEGYKFEFSTDGEKALEWVERKNFDLILLDVMMPDMSGFEVCEHIKKNSKTRDIPVIFLTAKADTEAVIKGFELGAMDYITKPFNKSELLARVSTHIALKKSRDEIVKYLELIKDSLNYAEKIQKAVLPSQALLNEVFSESFILLKPKDIVSGDFYWLNHAGNNFLIAAADCTGHGVPGAFMSMLGVTLLNEIVSGNRLKNPKQILNFLRKRIKTLLQQTGKDMEQKDGMDIALCTINTKNLQLQYAGAFNPLYIFRNHKLIEFKADRQPISIYIKETDFTNHRIDLKKGDAIYIFSDGYWDQLGGSQNRKFNVKQFKQLLNDIHDMPMTKQYDILNQTFEDWKGANDQLDDVLVMGMRM
jgi:sigma-B regulation protein RsbU (phosphoserine phosphatase)